MQEGIVFTSESIDVLDPESDLFVIRLSILVHILFKSNFRVYVP